MSFGNVIFEARMRLGLKQEDLAQRIKKEDGAPISKQYLSEIERGTRNPPSDLIINQFAVVLKVHPDVLYFHAGRLPLDIRTIEISDENVVEAFQAFRERIKL